MSLHRLVALVSATALVGLLGAAASASNHAPFRPRAAKVVAPPTLREKVRNAHIDGCGG